MPKAGSQQTLARQWEILKLIPARGSGITASELASTLDGLGFTVTKRTVERDLQELSVAFGLVCNDKAKPYGWRWADGVGHILPTPTLAEAVSINIVERQAKHLLPQTLLDVLEPQFRQASSKLEALRNANSITKWNDKIRVRPPSMPLLPPVMDLGVQETIQTAVINERQFQADYQAARSSDSQSLTLHPLGLVQRGPVTYLLATAFNYDDVRLYAAHRFKTAEMLTEKARIPEGFSIDKHLDEGALEFGKGKQLRLKVKVHEAIASFLAETPLSEDMVIKGEDEWREVTATVADTWQLRWWILSQGAWIEVQSPASLRKEIAKEVTAAHGLYQPNE